MTINHSGSVLIESKDFILRAFTGTDAFDIYNNWASDSRVTQFLTWNTHKDISETNDILACWISNYINKNFYLWRLSFAVLVK